MKGKVTISSKMQIDKVSNSGGGRTQDNKDVSDAKENLNSESIRHASQSAT